MTSQELAKEAAGAADDKKAQNIIILDVHHLTPVADCFVICSANSGTQVEAVSKAVREKMEAAGTPCHATEGLAEARWVLMDFGDVVVHVFRREEREFYNLERLWGDAVEVPYSVS
ncbi:ribosome silencing factor [Alicyclobacillus sp. SO9]|uniref:ribosome silencing factor n=1 Tax=Alicyclobacillus sp. SO9 TaxID=2665646 RepID=UPI0018E82E73|nr:ribosome silencing factor [Alicyclobacillus sp. SO9]QQE77359.1 ribosome silencing factor [Alicyclobacillus sp. SO9]